MGKMRTRRKMHQHSLTEKRRTWRSGLKRGIMYLHRSPQIALLRNTDLRCLSFIEISLLVLLSARRWANKLALWISHEIYVWVLIGGWLGICIRKDWEGMPWHTVICRDWEGLKGSSGGPLLYIVRRDLLNWVYLGVFRVSPPLRFAVFGRKSIHDIVCINYQHFRS